jgi:GDP-mannose transporter
MPVTLLLVSMIYTSSKGLQYLPISIFTIYKNMSIILIALGDVRYFGGRLTPLMLTSFILIIASSILGGLSDLQFNLRGYFWMFSNCASSAAYILYMRACIKKVSFMDFDTVYYNNLLSIPLLLFCSLMVEPWSISHIVIYSPNQLVLYWAIGISSIATFLISFGSAWSIRVASSTTYR